MAFRLGNGTNSVQNRACNAIVQTPDQGATNAAGAINIYTGTQPATPNTAPTGTLLVSIPLNNPSWGAAASGTSALVTTTAVSATVTTGGTAGWFRVLDRTNNTTTGGCWDGSCGTSGADLNFDNITFIAGGICTIQTMSITVPM